MKEPTIPEDIRTKLGIESLRFLRYSQNFVFRYMEDDGTERILRVTPGSHRSRDEIVAELDWIAHLRERGRVFARRCGAGRFYRFGMRTGRSTTASGLRRRRGGRWRRGIWVRDFMSGMGVC